MTPDERLVQAIQSLREENPDHVFDALCAVIEDLGFGWELTKRDPGPCVKGEDWCPIHDWNCPTEPTAPQYCEIDTGWCHTHNTWMNEHDWKLEPSELEYWSKKAGIIPEDAEMGSVSDITDSYRNLAKVRRIPND